MLGRADWKFWKKNNVRVKILGLYKKQHDTFSGSKLLIDLEVKQCNSGIKK
jgi:hypothetical protein